MEKFRGWHIFEYYQWLLEKIDGYKEPYYNYSLLLHELHSMPFIYSLEMDENRASDGIRLRWAYMDENNIPDLYYKDGFGCSVLEMMIGLAIRCDVEIMGDGDSYGTNAGKWFWIMIDNLDLMKCDDEHFSSEYVHQQIKIWLTRTFSRNGEGSPFPLHKKRCRDQRNVDIWFQMCGYLSENF